MIVQFCNVSDDITTNKDVEIDGKLERAEDRLYAKRRATFLFDALTYTPPTYKLQRTFHTYRERVKLLSGRLCA